MTQLIDQIKYILQNASISKIEVSAAPPFVKITIDRKQIKSLLQHQADVSNVIAETFIRRRVFWEDATRENLTYCINSLRDAMSELNNFVKEMQKSELSSLVILSQFVRSWSSSASIVYKRLKDDLSDIDQNKGQDFNYDSAHEDRRVALRHALIDLRKRIYPSVQALVEFLPEDDPTRREAQELLDSGAELLESAREIRQIAPIVSGAI